MAAFFLRGCFGFMVDRSEFDLAIRNEKMSAASWPWQQDRGAAGFQREIRESSSSKFPPARLRIERLRDMRPPADDCVCSHRPIVLLKTLRAEEHDPVDSRRHNRRFRSLVDLLALDGEPRRFEIYEPHRHQFYHDSSQSKPGTGITRYPPSRHSGNELERSQYHSPLNPTISLSPQLHQPHSPARCDT